MNNNQTQSTNKTESDNPNNETKTDQPVQGLNKPEVVEKPHWVDIQDFLVNLS